MSVTFYARPVINGAELPIPVFINGRSVSAMSGQYRTLDNFVRHMIKKYGDGHRQWNIYIGNTDHAADYLITLDDVHGINGFRQAVK